MAHESFEDEATAALMNEHFVNVKVDREERPDVDAVYMEATQAMTGHGGWPMTVFLTPDGEPFFGGTYFPPEPRTACRLPPGARAVARPGRRARATTSRARGAARRRTCARGARAPVARAAHRPSRCSTRRARCASDVRPEHGGFGGAPKFPPSMVLEFLLRHRAHRADARSRWPRSRSARRDGAGGMYDQLGGGFAPLLGRRAGSCRTSRRCSTTTRCWFRADDGGFHDTASDAEALVSRPRELGDNASPCGQSMMVHALATYAAITGEGAYRAAAEETLAVLAPVATRSPRFAGWSLAAAEALRDGPVEVAVVGRPGVERDELALAARRIPGAVVVVGEPGATGIPLLERRDEVGGRPAAYVCKEMVCERPVTDAASLSR
jgi:uncharacterized protein YyaL (SSP411 family)